MCAEGGLAAHSTAAFTGEDEVGKGRHVSPFMG